MIPILAVAETLADGLQILAPSLLMALLLGLWRALRLLWEIREDGRQNKDKLTLINGSVLAHLTEHTRQDGFNERLAVAQALAQALNNTLRKDTE